MIGRTDGWEDGQMIHTLFQTINYYNMDGRMTGDGWMDGEGDGQAGNHTDG